MTKATLFTPLSQCSTSRRHPARIHAFVATAMLALALSGCAYTPQNPESGTSVPGAAMGGQGGTGGGSAGGQNTGTASGGAGGGISTLPSPGAPEEIGTPSAPAPGSQVNPVPTTSSVSTRGLPSADFANAAASAPESPGATPEGTPDSRDNAEARGQDGSPDADANTRAADATDQVGTESEQTGATTGAISRSGPTAGEAGAGTGEIGDSPGTPAESDDESGQDGTEIVQGAGTSTQDAGVSMEPGNATTPNSGFVTGERGDLEGLDSGVAALPDASGAGVRDQPDAGANGAMTTAERRAAIRGRLDASFSAMNGLALSERERAQAGADAARRAGETLGIGTGGANRRDNGRGGDGTGERPAAIASNIGGTGGATMPGGGTTQQGDFNGAPAGYPIPADIPSGNDDDVVARQLREAAVREADPELREKLWDEYRKYTGLSR